MKYFSILLISGILLSLSCGQIAGVDEFDQLRRHADDSSLTDEQKERMQHNASVLAYKELIQEDSTFIDIDEDLIDFYYDVLVTVMTSDAGKEYDIISDIRVFHYVNLKGLLVQPFEDAPFYDAWRDSLFETGIPGIDSLIMDRSFELNSILYIGDYPGFFSFNSQTPTNTPRIGELLEETGFVISAGTNGFGGDGSRLIVEKVTDQRERMLKISYIEGSSDCRAGCINHYWYVFHVYEDGTVQFIDEFEGPRPG